MKFFHREITDKDSALAATRDLRQQLKDLGVKPEVIEAHIEHERAHLRVGLQATGRKTTDMITRLDKDGDETTYVTNIHFRGEFTEDEAKAILEAPQVMSRGDQRSLNKLRRR